MNRRSYDRRRLLPSRRTETRSMKVPAMFVLLTVVLAACGFDMKSGPSTTAEVPTPVIWADTEVATLASRVEPRGTEPWHKVCRPSTASRTTGPV